MKNIIKIFLLVVSLTMMFTLCVVPAFAEEAVADDTAAVAENDEKNEIVESYTDEDDNIILVFEDGKKYNATVGEWIEESEEKGMDIKFNPDNMLNSLQYMWKGMLCIFVVIGVIILSVYLMGFFSSRAAERKQAQSEESN